PTPEPVKPTPTPAPTPAPAEQTVAKTDPTPEPVKPTPTPIPTPAPAEQTVAMNKPPEASKPTPPTPSGPPAPAPAAAASAAPAARASGLKPLPTKLLLGDPKQYPKEWELQRGPTDFDHTTHIQPSYSKNCEECHHTNKDSRNEVVRKCFECHFQEGFTSKESKVNLKDAYHGVPDNTTNNA